MTLNRTHPGIHRFGRKRSLARTAEITFRDSTPEYNSFQDEWIEKIQAIQRQLPRTISDTRSAGKNLWSDTPFTSLAGSASNNPWQRDSDVIGDLKASVRKNGRRG
jgi:hypothetical protein